MFTPRVLVFGLLALAGVILAVSTGHRCSFPTHEMLVQNRVSMLGNLMSMVRKDDPEALAECQRWFEKFNNDDGWIGWPALIYEETANGGFVVGTFGDDGQAGGKDDLFQYYPPTPLHRYAQFGTLAIDERAKLGPMAHFLGQQFPIIEGPLLDAVDFQSFDAPIANAWEILPGFIFLRTADYGPWYQAACMCILIRVTDEGAMPIASGMYMRTMQTSRSGWMISGGGRVHLAVDVKGQRVQIKGDLGGLFQLPWNGIEFLPYTAKRFKAEVQMNGSNQLEELAKKLFPFDVRDQ